MKVYLAGKISGPDAEWRCLLKARGARWGGLLPDGHFWQVDIPLDALNEAPDGAVARWPEREVLLGGHTYIGPYRQETEESFRKASGDWHGVEARGQHGDIDGEAMDAIYSRCRSAVSRADLVFAVLNAPDAYGTIVELAWASLLGKFLAVLIHPRAAFDPGDFAFVRLMANFCPPWPRREVGHDDGTSTWLAMNERYDTLVAAGVPGLVAWERAEEEIHPYLSEPEAVPTVFRDALIAYGRWTENRPRVSLPPLSPPERRTTPAPLLQEATRSLTEIARWTSDPRVRGEAHRMIRRLVTTGEQDR